MRRLDNLQHLRAAAAVAVLLYHVGQWCGDGFKIGAAGVDLFFVISGVAMGLSALDPALTPSVFIKRRLWRIAPPYWIASLAVLGLALACPRLLPKVYPDLGHVLLSLLFIPHLDPTGLPFPLLPVGWSLSYEMVFYAIVAASLIAPPPRRARIVVWGLIGVMLFGVVARPAYFLFANPMMLQFMAGFLIAKAHAHNQLPRHGAGWGLILAGLVAYFGLSGFDLYASLWRPLLWGAPAALIVAGALSLERGVKARRLPTTLGDASYAIYLCHWPVVVMLAKIMGVSRVWVFAPSAILAALAVGLLYWRMVERPLLHWRGRALPAPQRLAVAAAEL